MRNINASDLYAISYHFKGEKGSHQHIIINEMVMYLPVIINKYQINTPLRICHFLSQLCNESRGFSSLIEENIDPKNNRYEHKKILGNTHDGDGYKYRGRGFIQVTGRYNYTQLSKVINLDLVTNPDLLSNDVHLALKISAIFWSHKHINNPADRDDAREVTYRINGGYIGYQDRLEFLRRAKKVFL